MLEDFELVRVGSVGATTVKVLRLQNSDRCKVADGMLTSAPIRTGSWRSSCHIVMVARSSRFSTLRPAPASRYAVPTSKGS